MESVKISPKKCKIAMALVGHHTPVNLQLSQKFQLPDQATRILDLLAGIRFLVAPGKWAAVNVEPWFKVLYDRWYCITLWFTGHPSLTVFFAHSSYISA